MKRLLPVLACDRRAPVRRVRRDDSASSSATTAGGRCSDHDWRVPRRRPRPRAAQRRLRPGGSRREHATSRSPASAALGTGQKATGDPIKIGSINTNVPGIDFTWISSMTKAYFDCVNDNGGINGRPIQYIDEDEHIDPAEIAGLADEARREDEVLGLVGNTSIIDCSVNGSTTPTTASSRSSPASTRPASRRRTSRP